MSDSNWEKWHYKDIRDPIYGFIGVTEEECEILDSPQMQRLRDIKQLACTNLVYPGAMHTRFDHSLGVLHIADRIAQRLNFKSHEQEVVRMAALLHDVGHGPFSHVFDSVMTRIHGKYDHSEIAALVIDNTELAQKLGNLKDEVTALLDNLRSKGKCGQVITSGLDSDRLDYLRRDSHFVGVEYGKFDLERIILTLSTKKNKQLGQEILVVKQKGVEAVEGFMLARYYMHLQVYNHRTRLITDAMLIRCLEKAIMQRGVKELKPLKKGIRDAEFISCLLSLTDFKMLDIIKTRAKGQSIELANMIDNRQLLKCAFHKPTEDIVDVDERRSLLDAEPQKLTKTLHEKERIIAKNAGVDPDWVFIHLSQVQNPLFKDPDHWKEEKNPIHVLRADGRVSTLEDECPLFGAADKVLGKIYVFCRAEDKDRVEKAARDYIDSL